MLLDKLYPLAAMCQAAQLVVQLALSGTCNEQALQTQIESLFIFEPKQLAHVYGNFSNLQLGLNFLNFSLHHPVKASQGRRLLLIRSFCLLAKKILHSPKIQKKLFEQLSRVEEQINYFGSWQHPRVIQNLTSIYFELANKFQLKLKIAGNKKYLEDVETLNKMRVVLFSGVRAAVLWYQLHGNTPWILLNRKKLSWQIEMLLIAEKTQEPL
jgi:high frequency lysogenization protein